MPLHFNQEATQEYSTKAVALVEQTATEWAEEVLRRIRVLLQAHLEFELCCRVEWILPDRHLQALAVQLEVAPGIPAGRDLKTRSRMHCRKL